MNNMVSHLPPPVNERVYSYAPGTPERASLQQRLHTLGTQAAIEVPAVIGGREVRTGHLETAHPPHAHARTLAHVHQATATEVTQAIEAALAARHDWSRMHWTDRAAIFLKAADLLAGPWRDTLNAATMLGQSKNAYQAEIDAACELIDFFRFNVYYAEQLYTQQPISSPGTWNRLQYRPLEGFVLAITPFNFTAIQGNLPTAPAIMGNTVVWKPAATSIFSAWYLIQLLEAAGLPPGVINLVPGPGPVVGNTAFASPHFAGLHFTGSTGTFNYMWRTLANNLSHYRSYPRIVGETGGKDFIVAHPSADVQAVATAIVRGGFEYQGQKCSAVSRVYLPASCYPALRQALCTQLDAVKMGPPEDFTCFVNAVIDRPSFNRITGYIDQARKDGVEVVHGGTYDDTVGYFVAPTVLRVDDPHYRTMEEEIFGPVVTLYVYDDARWPETLRLIDETSPYALTGAVFAQERTAIVEASEALADNAGNFYINDKPTGAVVGQQPFGGARGSGTNDKAGSPLNLVRWTSARTLKENFNPPHDFRYPFLQPDA
jgi:1-pyrroline-5-carboxylate dehydrogenase